MRIEEIFVFPIKDNVKRNTFRTNRSVCPRTARDEERELQRNKSIEAQMYLLQSKNDVITALIKQNKEMEEAYIPEKIIVSGPVTIVKWKDGTITKVRLAEGDVNDVVDAYANAVIKKMYGNRSRVKKAVQDITVYPGGNKKKDKKEIRKKGDYKEALQDLGKKLDQEIEVEKQKLKDECMKAQVLIDQMHKNDSNQPAK